MRGHFAAPRMVNDEHAARPRDRARGQPHSATPRALETLYFFLPRRRARRTPSVDVVPLS